MSSTTATHSYRVIVLSSVVITAQGDTTNLEYLTG